MTYHMQEGDTEQAVTPEKSEGCWLFFCFGCLGFFNIEGQKVPVLLWTDFDLA